jgi:hypothetical protein
MAGLPIQHTQTDRYCGERDPYAVEERLLSVYVFEIGGDRGRRNGPSDRSAVTRRGSGGATFVAMMEPAHLWDRDDPPGFWCLDGA